jgi:hypothetical protein
MRPKFHLFFQNVCCALLAVTMQAQTSVGFKAIVRAGEGYTHSIGHGLYFALVQSDRGDWNFQVKPSKDSKDNYTACLGSPFLHGPATIDLSAWRFAPGADAGWAERIPARKQFSFVTTAADQKYECAESKAIYDSFQRSQAKGEDPDYSGLPHYKSRPLGDGSVIVRSVALKPGLSDKNAEFEQVTLYVKVRFPTHRKPNPTTPKSTR